MNNNTPFFTIGIASYNYARYILRDLNQIKKQKFTDYEVLISDDGSSDNSVEVIRRFAKKNPQMNIRLIVKDVNEGLIANKNTIIENCLGKYLMLCDADDWMSNNYLEIAYQKIVAENPDRLICDVVHVGEKGRIIQTEHIPCQQTKWGWLIHHGSIYKADIIRRNNIQIKGEPDDVYFIMEFTKYCSRLSIIDEPHYFWYVHNDSEGRRQRFDLDDEYFNEKYLKEKKLVCQTIDEIRDSKNSISRRDIEELKLVFLKLYCRDILFRLQQMSLRDKYRYYEKLKKYCSRHVPDMWKCECLSLRSVQVMRPFAMNVIRTCKILELTNLMYPFLFGYHLLTKVIKIDQ